MADNKGGGHRATYSKDKRTGKYLVRVVGPKANMFAGRTVPVLTMSGDKHEEKLVGVKASGIDDGSVNPNDTGKMWALYEFEAKSQDEEEILF